MTAVQFMDGAAGDAQIRLLLAGDLQGGNYDLTRLFYLLPAGAWEFLDIPFVVVSLLRLPPTPGLPRVVALGRDGQAWMVMPGGGARTERLPDAGIGQGRHGYLSQVAQIGGALYACGDGGQVYRRGDAGWAHVDAGLLQAGAEGGAPLRLNGIGGTAADDLYVVGAQGGIHHCDGRAWSDVGVDSNLELNRLRCIDRDTVYVCGEGGALLRGNRDGWTWLAPDATGDELWDLEIFQGRLYVASDGGLLVYDEARDTLLPVDTGLSPPPDGHRLSTNGTELWSIGETELAWFDGARWQRLVHPDNGP